MQLTPCPPPQALRHGALEALSRLPASEAFKPYAARLVDVSLGVSGSACPFAFNSV